MTTPTDFAAWRAEAMRLADEIRGTAFREEYEACDAARAALSQHLLAVPMGSPAAEAVMNLCADHQGPVEAMTYIPEGTHLFTKPEGMA